MGTLLTGTGTGTGTGTTDDDPPPEAGLGVGVVQPDGSCALRGVRRVPGGPLTPFAPVPEHSPVQVVSGDRASALSVLWGVEPLARTSAAVVDDPAVLLTSADRVPVSGSSGCGEVASTRGSGGAHSAALRGLAL